MQINPWLALGVFASTAATDAVYVLFNAAVSARRRLPLTDGRRTVSGGYHRARAGRIGGRRPLGGVKVHTASLFAGVQPRP